MTEPKRPSNERSGAKQRSDWPFLPHWLKNAATNCRGFLNHAIWHHRRHWAVVIVLIYFGGRIGHYLETNEQLFEVRYFLYQWFQNASPWPLYSRDTIVVLVDDETYWKGEPAGRVPINREFLADLVKKIAEARPAIIALDFDLRSPDPTGKETATTGDRSITLCEREEYVEETATLLKTLQALSASSKIVLPRTVNTLEDGRYSCESDVYGGFNFKPALNSKSARIRSGYIQLPFDRRIIPPALKTTTANKPVDSFALAIARMANPEIAKKVDGMDEVRYGAFFKRGRITEITAGQLLRATPEEAETLKDQLESKIVIIGAEWRDRGFGRGRWVDSLQSPVGIMPAVFLHANYVEAILAGKLLEPIGENLIGGVEWALGLLLALVLLIEFRPLWKFAAVVGIIALPLLVSRLAVQNLGLYADVLMVDFLLVGHFAFEKIDGWRRCCSELKSRLAANGRARQVGQEVAAGEESAYLERSIAGEKK